MALPRTIFNNSRWLYHQALKLLVGANTLDQGPAGRTRGDLALQKETILQVKGIINIPFLSPAYDRALHCIHPLGKTTNVNEAVLCSSPSTAD